MRNFLTSIGFGLVLALVSLGCGTDASNGGGSGGTAGTSGSGGGTGAAGGLGGEGGTGGIPPRICINPRDCDDGQPCTKDLCTDRICVYEPLAEDTVCVSDTGLSTCMAGVCQLIWPDCSDAGAEEGDFCESTEDSTRLGRCVSGSCEILSCELAFDCWDGDLCTDDVCDDSSGECSHPTAADGTSCGIVVPMVCMDGDCVIPVMEP